MEITRIWQARASNIRDGISLIVEYINNAEDGQGHTDSARVFHSPRGVAHLLHLRENLSGTGRADSNCNS